MRVLGIALAVLLSLVLIAVASVYGLSERVVRERHEVAAAPFALALPTDSASIAEGERLARTRGCTGCHGVALEGEVFFSEPGIATVSASNLTLVASRQSDAVLERAIRHGVREDGTALYSMPSEMYRSLTDEDLARILAFVRSLPVVAEQPPARSLGPLGRVGILAGELHNSVYYIKTETPLAPPADSALRLGHYVAITSCTECHTNTMEGGDGTPSIVAILPSYSRAEFAEFLKTGLAKGGRELPMMSGVARRRLSHLTPAEVESLYDYLISLKSGGGVPATQ